MSFAKPLSVYLAMLCLIGVQAAEAPILVPRPNTTSSSGISKALDTWNEKNAIQLQRHQLLPIDYLEKNPDIKGLIINHYLGTGKTYLAIGFAERNIDKTIIILGPRFLKAHWLKHLALYGVNNKQRYRFVSHDDCAMLAKEDLSNAVVIIDESHRFIQKVRMQNKYNEHKVLYFNLRNAYRLLALTGTPIYDDVLDLVYQINLVSGKNKFSFNEEEFYIHYSKIHAFKSFVRGYFLESIHLPHGLDLIANFILRFFFKPLSFEPKDTAHNFLLSVVFKPSHWFEQAKANYSLDYHPMRDFDLNKLQEIVGPYISYYNFDTKSSDYPAQLHRKKNISYNGPQVELLFNFYDSRLNHTHLSQMLKDNTLSVDQKCMTKENIVLNNSHIQDMLKAQKGAGREIGNFSFVNQSALRHVTTQNGNLPDVMLNNQAIDSYVTIPEKFKQIIKTINKGKSPAVVYSHYYYNGLLLFKQFLDQHHPEEKYAIFHPAMSTTMQEKVIDDFNNGKIKILLLHPEVTEGVSLKGARQFHFLEMPINSALQNQIIGRVIRYQSHTHLPATERNVTVYTWCNTFSLFDIKARTTLRKNWHQRFCELNYYSSYGAGREQIDKNNSLKKHSPDTRAAIHLNDLHRKMENFRVHIKQFCIEKLSYSN